MTWGDIVVNWIDLIWIPVALVVPARRGQKVKALLFVLLCALTMRLQIEVIHSTGHMNGFTTLFSSDVKLRATIIYGIFTALYLLLLHYSPRSKWYVTMAASIVVYFTAFVTSMLIMAF